MHGCLLTTPMFRQVSNLFVPKVRANANIDKHTDLESEPVNVVSGTIWTALNVDYPGHSFSHFGAFHGKH